MPGLSGLGLGGTHIHVFKLCIQLRPTLTIVWLYSVSRSRDSQVPQDPLVSFWVAAVPMWPYSLFHPLPQPSVLLQLSLFQKLVFCLLPPIPLLLMVMVYAFFPSLLLQ